MQYSYQDLAQIKLQMKKLGYKTFKCTECGDDIIWIFVPFDGIEEHLNVIALGMLEIPTNNRCCERCHIKRINDHPEFRCTGFSL
jgi:hypothetical protein